MPRSIVLVGFMGTGKTVVGRELARLLNRPFVDVDELLQQQVGMPIGEFFAAEGESAFRKLEKQAIGALARQGNLVVATGGGAVLDRDNVAALQKNGILILLTAEPETIARRLAGDTNRPLLGPQPCLNRLKQLLRARAGAYRAAAQYTVATDDLDPGEAAKKIMSLLSPN